MESTGLLLQKVETCTLAEFTRSLYRRVERVEIRNDLPPASGALRPAEGTMKFVLGVQGRDERERLLVFAHIVLYSIFVVHGHLDIEEEELPFFVPYAQDGAAGRFLNLHYTAVKKLFESRYTA